MGEVDPEVGGLGPDLAVRLGHPDLRLESATRLTAGASRSTWMLEIACGTGDPEGFVLQRERVRGAGLSPVVTEAALLSAAHAVGVPVPEVVAVDPVGDSVGGSYVVTRQVEGETLARRILRDDAFADVRAGLASELGTILARIHAIPVDALPAMDAPDVLGAVETMLDEAYDARPALELGLAWLRRHRPEPVAPSLVHGDFRLGNLIVGADGVRAVLDWELAHLGDPREDLGWVCSPAWRFGGPLPVAGCGTREELWAAYEAAGGAPVDPDVALWWEVFAIVQWGAMCTKQARTHLSGASRSAELAVLGRRAVECEHDLFAAVFPGSEDPAPATASEPSDLFGRPTAAELVEAVREQLEQAGDFPSRVAANALKVVERELAVGAAAEHEHRERLRLLGFSDDAGLAAAIRKGEVFDEVVPAVRADVAARLAVYRPAYAS